MCARVRLRPCPPPLLSCTCALAFQALTTGAALTEFKAWIPAIVAIGAVIATTVEWEQLQTRHRNVSHHLGRGAVGSAAAGVIDKIDNLPLLWHFIRSASVWRS